MVRSLGFGSNTYNYGISALDKMPLWAQITRFWLCKNFETYDINTLNNFYFAKIGAMRPQSILLNADMPTGS